ncbi:MAG: hypothetical protein DUD27_03540 [Lachnospiraceae bacterium]|uniref:Fibronectin type-III domain-containing protein n=1 Tax=Candidatus Weimeria bifida TaxID=2599074 RepID=A0A6N7IZP2_9FIRM|nr:hypothetical protein [Candidatus Weimeria bifida]RRF96690.1 MAG: hypothetical protein DUD27_03540 [Lachnospiraceae bacterium]
MRYLPIKKFAVTILTAAMVTTPVFTPTRAEASLKMASWGVGRLSSSEKKMYDHLISELGRILKNGGSTKITFNSSSYKLHLTSGQDALNIWKKLYTYASNNHPELLCYQDLLSSKSSSVGVTLKNHKASSFTAYIAVDESYQGSGKDKEHTLSKSALTKLKAAEKEAARVISANSKKGIYDTIKAYADYIAGQVSYDQDAADGYRTNSSPWSLISVFDRDPSTNVVCEGYTKAFQYLMDNTTKFTNAGIVSKIVTSNAGGIGHMWNVVTIGGKNYIVDVTWYDKTTDSPSYKPQYILGGQSVVDNGDTFGEHTYDDDTREFYTNSELKLSDTSFDKTTEKALKVKIRNASQKKQSASSKQISSIKKKRGSITKISVGKRKLTISFKKVKVSGKTVKYQTAIKRSTAKKWNESYTSSTKKTFTKLKKGKTYWVSVRPYITVNGRKYFGKWSKTLTRKAK